MKTPPQSIYAIEVTSIEGKQVTMEQFKGKHLLIVNVASECGFTNQYEALQKVHEEYGDRMAVIGVPCNQFGEQEPGDEAAIASFCEVRYGVTFFLTQKVDVKGELQHPLYDWLTSAAKNGVKDSTVKWNFQKYLVDDEGRLIDYYFSITKPDSKKILKHLS